MDEREQIEAAIAAQEALRGVLSDDIVDATVAALRGRMDALLGAGVVEKRRKQVTVLFADVSGFTRAAENMDAEDLADTVNALWHRLDAAIVEYNGRVDKHIGDAVMGLWGTDEAREDDPEQAIRAALAMQASIEELASAAAASQLRLRIGINTGPVVLGEVGTTGEYTAMGNTVNVASRLENAAPVGGILINHDTYRHVRGVFSVEMQPPLEVKGMSEPLRTYIVKAVRPRAFRLETRGIEGVETRMVGREAELRRLQEALGRVIAGNQLTLFEVVGDAGIGKSRLLYEFEDWLRLQPAEIRLFTGRADRQHQGVPFALARDMFYSRFEIEDTDPPHLVLSKLESGVAHFLAEGAREQAHFIGHLLGLDMSSSEIIGGIIDDAKQLHDRALAAVTKLFLAVTREAPTVVLLEDIHWADLSSLQLVLHIAETCENSPILIVALARPSLFDRVPGWSEGLARVHRIHLVPLSEEESERLVLEVLQRLPSVPEIIRDRVVANAEGNPFYVEELIRMMIEDGVIITSDDVWRMEQDRLTDLQVPATLTGVLQARLDRLPSRERRTLERASVVGRIFWDGAIPPPASDTAPPAGSAVPSDLPQVLDALQGRELIRPHGSADFAGTSEFIFKHAILHEVTYEGVLKSLRRVYHAWVAEWLAARPEITAHPAMIARHYELAEAPDEAASWYARAARQAQGLFANDDAIAYFRLALRPENLDPAARVALNQGLGEVLMLQARYDEALEAIGAMLTDAQASGDVAGQARALHAMSTTHTRLGNSREALQTAEEAAGVLRRSDASFPTELADVLKRLGWAHLRLGHIDEARTHGEEALALAEDIEHHRGLRGTLNLLGALNAALGSYEQAAGYFERALRVTQDLGDRIGEGRALLNLGEVARLQGDFERAAAMSRQALAIQQELGDRDQRALTMSNIGAAHVGLKNYEQAVAELRRAGGEFTAAGASEHISETCRLLAEAYLGSGELAEATEEAKQALRHAAADENPEHIGHAWRILGRVAGALDQAIEVEWEGSTRTCDVTDCFETSLAVFTGAGMEADRALVLWDWAVVQLSRGDMEAGEARWREARAIFANLGLTFFEARMDAERQVLGH